MARGSKIELNGYDGDWKTRDFMAYASGGHRISERFPETKDGKKAAAARVMAWLGAHPPLNREAFFGISVVGSDGSHYGRWRGTPHGDKWKFDHKPEWLPIV